MLKNLKLGQRLGAAFAAILFLLVCNSILGVNGIGKTFDSVTAMYGESVIPLAALSDVEYLATRNRILAMDTILNPAPANVEKRSAEQIKNSDKLDASWKIYLGTNLTDPEKELVKVFEPAVAEYRSKGIVPIREAAQAGKTEEALNIYKTQLSPLAPKVFETIAKLKEIQIKLAKEQFDQSAGVNKSVKMMTFGVTLLSILLGVFLAWVITRSITVPMDEAVKIAQLVSEGDLTSDIKVDSKDETGQLLQALKNMNAGLENIVQQVRSGTDTISLAATEIAQGNQDLSARTESQAGALQETASSMEELTSTVRQNAENAKQANQLAQKASDVAIKGGDAVAQVVETMAAINDSSKKIVDIISVIDGIAFQTNILALNAAVEAARAGEQGRGFAVVASEVRNLAQRSAAAAKEIKELIGNSVEKVEAGSRQVNAAGTTMNDVVSSIRMVTDIMVEITAASQEQSQGIDQINHAVVEMDNVTQQNAALVEEAAAAASSMQDQSANLVKAVDFFRINGAANSSARTPARTATRPAPVLKRPNLAAKPAPKLNRETSASAAKSVKQIESPDEQGWEEF